MYKRFYELWNVKSRRSLATKLKRRKAEISITIFVWAFFSRTLCLSTFKKMFSDISKKKSSFNLRKHQSYV